MHVTVRIQIATLVAILLCAGVPTPQGGVTQVEEILTAEARWIDAIRSGDFAALEKVLSDDLVYTHSSGIVATKKEFLGKVHLDVKSVEYSDRKIQLFGNTAVLTAQARITGGSKRQSYDNRVRIIHVWAMKGGGWQLVAHQTTRLP